jgi:predicted nucleotidyltransferase
MTTSLNASRHIDRISADLLLAVNAAAVELEISYCVVGAFARDVVLGCCYGINTGQATRDIDFGLMLDNWTQFQTLRSHLLQRHDFAEFRGIAHRLAFRGVRELDIVPFGGLERRPGEIAWPPDFSIVMSTLGLRQAQACALRITVAADVDIPFVSPAALTLLKLVAWNDRGSAVNTTPNGCMRTMRNYWTKTISTSMPRARAFSAGT